MRHFAGIEKEYSAYSRSAVLLQPVPYDGTSTWGKGADRGFDAFMEASENMELYDIETGTEVYREGIHVLPEITESSTPESVYKAVYRKTAELLKTGKFLTFFGGEHSISIGIIRAFYETFPGLTVLQLDAHTDLRPEYLGSKYNHACAMSDANKNTNLIQAGIRSMDMDELKYLNKENCYFAREMGDSDEWMERSISQMTDRVYITLDLDVFDPSIMPATGTPEPGGLDYQRVLKFLKKVFLLKEVVGFDIVELAPIKDFKAPQFLVAKLYYKMLSYKFSKP